MYSVYDVDNYNLGEYCFSIWMHNWETHSEPPKNKGARPTEQSVLSNAERGFSVWRKLKKAWNIVKMRGDRMEYI